MRADKKHVNRCPRCNSQKIITYEETIDCTQCGLEFEIKDIIKAHDKRAVLSIQEKLGILDSLNT